MTLEKRLHFVLANPFGVVGWALGGAVMVGFLLQLAIS
jgi:hypothetical protein